MTTTHPAHAAPDNSSTHDEHHHDNLLVKYGAPKVMAALFVGVLLLQMGFILSYVAAFHQPTPRDIEIAVIADQAHRTAWISRSPTNSTPSTAARSTLRWSTARRPLAA